MAAMSYRTAKLSSSVIDCMGRSALHFKIMQTLRSSGGSDRSSAVDIEKVLLSLVLDARKPTSSIRERGFVGGWNKCCDELIARLGSQLHINLIQILHDNPGPTIESCTAIERNFADTIRAVAQTPPTIKEKGYHDGWIGACEFLISQIGEHLQVKRPATNTNPH